MFHGSKGQHRARLETTSRRSGDWNVTDVARPKSCRCLILPVLLATEAWRRRVLCRDHFPHWGRGGFEAGRDGEVRRGISCAQ